MPQKVRRGVLPLFLFSFLSCFTIRVYFHVLSAFAPYLVKVKTETPNFLTTIIFFYFHASTASLTAHITAFRSVWPEARIAAIVGSGGQRPRQSSTHHRA
jgi:hypothetical protein